GRRVRRRRDAALVRQAVRARLLRAARVGQDVPGARASRRRRFRYARTVRRGVRAPDGHRVRRLRRRPNRGAGMKATVLVRPKPGILDPQGQAVESSLRHLGFEVGGTRVGRLVDVELATDDRSEAAAQLEQMCERLLTNPLIESYTIAFMGDASE